MESQARASYGELMVDTLEEGDVKAEVEDLMKSHTCSKSISDI